MVREILSKDIRGFSRDAVLRDGASIHLRAIRPEDKDGLLSLLSRMSPDSVYFRF